MVSSASPIRIRDRWKRPFGITSCAILWLLGSVAVSRGVGSDFEIQESETTLAVADAHGVVLVYNKVSPPVPDGIDAIYARSGFLHPVFTPNGQVVTEAFPKDHPHQNGIFSAWVKTTYADREVDFWNLGGGAGRVLHHRVVTTFDSASETGFEVELIHRSEKPTPIDVLRERWRVSVRPTDSRYRCFDLESIQEAITDVPLVIEKYHYGGMAWRGPSRWLTKADRDVAGSDAPLELEPTTWLNQPGEDRIRGNHTPTDWVAVSGTLHQRPATVVVLSHPSNFRSPQAARLHPSKPYFCFTPCVSQAFSISRSAPVRARYRFLVSDMSLDPAWISDRWKEWTQGSAR